MVDNLLAMAAGTRLYLLAPIVRGRKGEYRKELAELHRKGFSRVRINGEIYDVEETPTLDKQKKHDIEVVVDRIVIQPEADELATRLADSLETALGLSDGLAFADDVDSGARVVFSARFACPDSGFTIDEIEPRLFSFNNPFGACPDCDGLGVSSHFDEQLVVPDRRITLRDGALAPWSSNSSRYYLQTLESLARQFAFSLDVPFQELPAEIQSIVLYGSGKTPVVMEFDDGLRSYRTTKPFEGSFPIWPVGIAKPTPPGCARRWINFAPTSHARPAKANA